MNKIMQKWAAGERLRRAREQQEREAAVSGRVSAAHADGRSLGRVEGRRETGAIMAQVTPPFVERILEHAAREFGCEMARKMDAKVPGQIVVEVATEVWAMLQRGDLRALGHDNRAYVNFRVEDRGDLVLDARIPEMRWQYGIPREEVLLHRDRFYR